MKPYRPSNGTEGMIFQNKFCDVCKHDNYTDEKPQDGCEILLRSLCYGIGDADYPEEWIWNPDKCFTEKGLSFVSEYGPRCTAFEASNE